MDAGEPPIGGVGIGLTGTDDRGDGRQPRGDDRRPGGLRVLRTAPGTYTISETQAAGYADGKDALGAVNGTVTGNATVNDRFSAITLPAPDSVAAGYAFGERNPVEVDLISRAPRASDTAERYFRRVLGEADGRFVVFTSTAVLTPGDTNGLQDVYIRDIVSGTTALVSVSPSGGTANGISSAPVIERRRSVCRLCECGHEPRRRRRQRRHGRVCLGPSDGMTTLVSPTSPESSATGLRPIR